MKKFVGCLSVLLILLTAGISRAEDVAPVVTEATVQAADKAAEVIQQTTVEAVSPPAAPVVEAVAPAVEPSLIAETPVVAPAATPAEVIATDNLEFISGEVSAIDEATQSVTVKLYGETETGASDKSLTVVVDSTTDITDGEQDRDLKSLTAGTEVDVEYDPSTNKATYIFVY